MRSSGYLSARRGTSVGRGLKINEIAARTAKSSGSLRRHAPSETQPIENTGLIQRKSRSARKDPTEVLREVSTTRAVFASGLSYASGSLIGRSLPEKHL